MKLTKTPSYEEFQDTIWNKYRHSPTETPADIFNRVADAYYPEMKKIFFNDDGSLSYRVIPGGRVLYAAGKEGASPYNCSVLPSPEDSMEGIFETAKRMAVAFKSGLGVGMDISTLRPEGSKVKKGSAKYSTGAWSWSELFSTVTGIVGQSNRRGALLLSIDISHPDVRKFIHMKNELNSENKNFLSQLSILPEDENYEKYKYLISRHQVRYANISVRVTDDFMKAVLEDRDWTLSFTVHHDDGEDEVIEETVKARDLWNDIIDNMYESSEPGFLFIDTMQKNYILHDFEPIVTTNPCVTGDTWIMTSDGPKQVYDLVGKQFDAVVNGEIYKTTPEGFFYTGKKKVYKVTTTNGYSVKTTSNHKFMKVLVNTNELLWTELKDLNVGDRVLMKESLGMEEIKSIEYIGEEDVYDVQVPGINAFDGNGFYLHNCGEISLSEWGVCNLISVNLVEHLDDEGNIDWQKLEETIRYAVRFADSLIDKAYYPFKEFEETSKRQRKIGLGLMGLADVFLLKQMRYGSDESVALSEEISKFFAKISFDESANLSKEFGAAPAIKNNFDKYDDMIEASEFLQQLVKEFPQIGKKIKKYGLRNSNLLSIAPTGTISLIAGVSSAFEPVFYFEMERWSDSFKKSVKFEHPAYTTLKDKGVINDGEKPNWLVSAADIDPMDKLRIHKALQKWFDLNISNTYTISRSASKKDIENLIIEAWRGGVKGITIYKEGTRGSIIRDASTKKEKSIDVSKLNYDRPQSLTARSYKYTHNDHNYYIIVAGERNTPLEIYLGSKNIKEQSYIIALNSIISTILKTTYVISKEYNMNIYRYILDKIIHELSEIKDSDIPYFYIGKRYYSPVSFWAFSLNYFKDNTTPDKEKEKRISIAVKQVNQLTTSDKKIFDFYPGGIDDEIPDDAVSVECPNCGSIIWTKREAFEFDCNEPCPNCGYSFKCE